MFFCGEKLNQLYRILAGNNKDIVEPIPGTPLAEIYSL